MNKTLDNIYEEMLAVFAEVSGYLPSTSCDLAARLYAAAAQIQGLYLQAQWLLDQSFPQTAKGVCLDQHAQLRGISRGVATRAAGTLRFGLSSAVGGDLNVDAGTVCMTASGIRRGPGAGKAGQRGRRQRHHHGGHARGHPGLHQSGGLQRRGR